jgi:hypothetical protein
VGIEDVSLAVKQHRHESNHSSQSSAEVKNDGVYTSNHTSNFMAWFLIKNKDVTFFSVDYFIMLQSLRYIVLNSMMTDQLKRIWKEVVWPNGSQGFGKVVKNLHQGSWSPGPESNSVSF